MREIKFRAWWQPIKLEYRKGVVTNPPKMLQVGDDSGTKTGLDCCVYANQGQNVILIQYTGLKDRNGKEIYEGDILRVEYYRKPYLVEVAWCLDGYSLRNPKSKAWFISSKNLSMIEKSEIAGNIYENPELLKEV